MKKIASILMLGLLLFNWFGYRLLGTYLENRATFSLEEQLNDQHYNESDLFYLKIPVRHLSSYTNSTNFERVDGHIEISGIQYNYVKRRVTSDSIEMLCIPNYASTQVKKNSTEFFKLINDIRHGGHGKKAGHCKDLSGGYFKKSDLIGLSRLFYQESKPVPTYSFFLPSYFPLSVERPPDQQV